MFPIDFSPCLKGLVDENGRLADEVSQLESKNLELMQQVSLLKSNVDRMAADESEVRDVRILIADIN